MSEIVNKKRKFENCKRLSIDESHVTLSHLNIASATRVYHSFSCADTLFSPIKIRHTAMNHIHTYQKLFGLLAITASSLSLNGQTTTFNDTFDVGTNPTVGDDAGDPNDTAWTTANDVSISVNTGNQLGSGNSLDGNVSGSLNLTSTTFSTQTLSSVGDSLSISFDYAYNGAAGQTEYIPAFGLYDSSIDEGYYGRVDNTSLRIFQEDDSASGYLAGSDSTSDLVQVFASNYSYGGQEVRFGLTLTRTASNEVTIAMSIVDPADSGNNVSFSGVDSTGALIAFDTFALRSRSTDFYMDNVTLEYSAVPEPGAFALIAGSLALFAIMIRRRQ